jgi:membrane protein DedA with SNARE-associated domain
MINFEHDLGMLEPLIHQYGVAGVFLILMLESCGVPLPGESLLVIAAVLSGRGEFSFAGLFFAAWAGAVSGDNLGYLIGRRLGRNLLGRYGGKIGLNAERLHKIEAIFARYGPLTVGVARFFSVLRQLNGVVAGTLKMDWWRFLIFNTFGGGLWVLVWTMAGFYLGSHAANIFSLVHKIGFISVIIAFAVTFCGFVFAYRRRILAYLRSRAAEKTKE